MRSSNHATGDELVGRRFEYDDSYVVSMDLPFPDDAVSVDVVGDTAIVVVDRDGEGAQAEFELPGPAETIDVHNGVLSITIQK